MNAVSVLIVDDSFFMRRVIRDILQADPSIEIVGEAANGEEALTMIAELSPAVVTLDIEMPRMNGLEALGHIMSTVGHPSVVIVSGYVKAGADVTLQCLAMGATDFVLKPAGSFSLNLDGVKDMLLEKVKVAAQADTSIVRSIPQPLPSTRHYNQDDGVVVIGASTGGPAALELLLPAFPPNFPFPIVVAQHLPKSFAKTFGDRLAKKCALAVKHAETDTPLRPGTIYLAPGGSITTVVKKDDTPVLAVTKNTDDIETPSVNKLMSSAAEAYRDKTIGIILTGMGKDGLHGMEQIKKVGGRTIVQDKSTSVVYGMGQAVVEDGLADVIAPLDQIIDKLNDLVAASK
jgi:two-component system chemotaxis response regulator CheB